VRTEILLAGHERLDFAGQTSSTTAGAGAPFAAPRVAGADPRSHTLHSAKGFQHQRMTNGAMNVEIGNPTYKMYEGEPDDDVGELLDADFALDPDKVRSGAAVAQRGQQLRGTQRSAGDAEGHVPRWGARCCVSVGAPWGCSLRRRLRSSEGPQRLREWRLWGGTAAATGSVVLYREEVVAGAGSHRSTPGQGTPLGPRCWGGRCLCPLPPAPSSPQPTNFTNPVYATLYMGAHNSRNSLASTDEKRELLSRGADDDLADPLA